MTDTAKTMFVQGVWLLGAPVYPADFSYTDFKDSIGDKSDGMCQAQEDLRRSTRIATLQHGSADALMKRVLAHHDMILQVSGDEKLRGTGKNIACDMNNCNKLHEWQMRCADVMGHDENASVLETHKRDSRGEFGTILALQGDTPGSGALDLPTRSYMENLMGPGPETAADRKVLDALGASMQSAANLFGKIAQMAAHDVKADYNNTMGEARRSLMMSSGFIDVPAPREVDAVMNCSEALRSLGATRAHQEAPTIASASTHAKLIRKQSEAANLEAHRVLDTARVSAAIFLNAKLQRQVKKEPVTTQAPAVMKTQA